MRLRIENANGGALTCMRWVASLLGMSGNADGTISGNLIPSANATYSIGSSSYGWKELRLSQYGVSGRITIDGDGINREQRRRLSVWCFVYGDRSHM